MRVSLSLGALKPGTDPSLARKVRVASSSGRGLFFSALRICRSALALLGGVPQRLHPHVRPHLRVAVTKTASSVDLVDPAPPASPSSVASSPLSRTEPKRVRASAGRGSGVRGAVPVRSSSRPLDLLHGSSEASRVATGRVSAGAALFAPCRAFPLRSQRGSRHQEPSLRLSRRSMAPSRPS